MNQFEKKKIFQLNMQIVTSQIINFHVLQNQQHWEMLTFVHYVACVNVFSPVHNYSAEP